VNAGGRALQHPAALDSRRYRVLRALALLVLFLPLPCSGPCTTASSEPAVDLSLVSSSLRLTSQLSIQEDRSAQLDVAGALASRGWQTATPRTLNRGHTRSALWLKGTLYNGGTTPVTRWLSVGAMRLEDIRYYRLDTDAPVASETWLAGNRMPIDSRPVRAALSTFPLTLSPGQRIRFMLRIESRSAVGINVSLWTPAAFNDAAQRASMLEMLLAGSMLTIALYALILGFVLRDHMFFLLALCIGVEMFYEFAFQGYLYCYVVPGGGALVLRAPSIGGSATTAAFAATVMAFSGIGRIAYWKWIYRALIGVMCVCCVWNAFGDYRTSSSVSIVAIFVCNTVWVVSMLDGWRRGFANARSLLLSFAPGCATFFLRLAVAHGVLSEKWLTGSSASWDKFSILLMMLLIIGGRSRQVQRAQQQAQRKTLEARAREQERLEQAVGERTQALQAALIAADEANRAKADFLARVSHDLRTPLTSIIGFADLVQAAGREDAERGRIIHRSANHMLEMVNDLIDYAGGADPNVLRPSPTHIHALLDSIAQDATALASKRGNRFILDIRSDLPPILELDSKRILQVLDNLIDNAAKFTQSGIIELSIECRPDSAQTCSVILMFSVSDTGCGIAQADHDRIFEPFLRLDAARHQPGVGLGLSIVKQWISHMNGTLAIESAPGIGTTVRVSVAARPVEEAAVAQPYVADTANVPVVGVSATPRAVSGHFDDDGQMYDTCLLKPVNRAELHSAPARSIETEPVQSSGSLEPPERDRPLIRPSVQALGEAQQLIRFGAISDLIDWAENIAVDEPECTAFARQAQRLAGRGDLSGLEAICRT
jgi:signal transduction histidine kinase